MGERERSDEGGSERTCVVSGEKGPPEAMLRFVLSGAGEVVPDLRRKLPGRGEVSAAVRALKAFPGITGPLTFNAKGDLVTGKYFVIQVTSAEPAKWPSNRIDQTLSIAPPQ